MEQLLFDLDTAGAVLGGTSRSTVYDLVNSGDIKLVKIGRRSYITAASVTAYVDRLAAADTPLASV